MRRRILNPRYDLAIAGAGFAGSIMAMIAARLGLAVVLIERGRHPRVVIGESSTPLSNLLLEQLADTYDLPVLRSLAKWGTWQQYHPDLACGLKRGFTFFHHNNSGKQVSPADRQLLVAASPNDAIADTHWFRADLDHYLVRQACTLGVTYLDECVVHDMDRQGDAWALRCEHQGTDDTVHARFIIDATGPRGLLHRVLGLGEATLPSYPETSAVYSHFTGVENFAGAQQYDSGMPPYPPDSAALHHVFEGGWMWVLRFDNGWTSAGVAATRAVAEHFRFSEEEAAWHRVLDTLPEVKEHFASACAVRPFTYVPQLSFRSAEMAGPGWAMLPSAAGFVDPLLSTGFPLTLLGVARLGEILACDWNAPTLDSSLADYAHKTDGELLATADLIAALYATMHDFTTFRTLTLLYFAAASYAETARRLDKPQLAESFLLHTHPVFGPALRGITARAQQPLTPASKSALQTDVFTLIKQFDVAGLCSKPPDHCYPVRAEDLFAGAHTVHASTSEIENLLRRTGFYSSTA